MRKGFLLSILGIGLSSLVLAQSSSPRSLFLSTQGSPVHVRDKEDVKAENKASVRKHAKSANNTKTSSQAQSKSSKIYLGAELQVLVPSGNLMKPINPKTHVFKEGDMFKVQLLYNSPGLVEFVNIDRTGKERYLGKWVVEKSFEGAVLPGDGWFRFEGPKGKDLLLVRFYPCSPNEGIVREVRNVSSRSIGFVRDEKVGEVKVVQELSSLPACTDLPKKEPTGWETYASSRSISYVGNEIVEMERKNNKLYHLVSYESYMKNREPIVTVIEFNYE